MDRITAIFNIYFFDNVTVLVEKNKTTIINKSRVRQNTGQICK